MLVFVIQANCDYYRRDATTADALSPSANALLVEPAWQQQQVSDRHSLVELCCQQRETNYRLIDHHTSLTYLVAAVLVFNMKSVRIMTLFDHNVCGRRKMGILHILCCITSQLLFFVWRRCAVLYVCSVFVGHRRAVFYVRVLCL